MKKVTTIYFETIDGKKFFVNDHTSEDKARGQAKQHEFEVLLEQIGSFKYYVIEVYEIRSAAPQLVGYIPRIKHNRKGYTRFLKFAQKYEKLIDALRNINESELGKTKKIIGLNE